MNFPSKLTFASYLQYSPKGVGERGESSRDLRTAIKNDQPIYPAQADGSRVAVNAIDRTVELLSRAVQENPFLAKYFGADVTLVPLPRSSPLKTKDALWPSHRICRAMLAAKLGGDIAPIIERHTPVQKAAHAGPGKRPDPPDHYASTGIGSVMLAGKKITLVDDFITRGSSFVGIIPHLSEAFPGFEINCFALVRTESYQPVDQIVSPVEGIISFEGGRLRRTP